MDQNEQRQAELESAIDTQSPIVQSPRNSTIVLLILTLAAIGLLIGIGSTKLNKTTPKIDRQQAVIAKPSAAAGRFVELDRIEPSGSKTPIITTRLDNTDWTPPIVYQWQDYLIIFDKESKEIKSHDLKSGETRVLDTISQWNLQEPVIWPQVIEGSQYFSYGGYMNRSPVYYVIYPLIEKPKILKDEFEGAQFMLINGVHFLKGGTGDSCYSREDYSLFDPTTKQSWPTFSSFGGCGFGPHLIDFIKDGKAIMSNRDDDKNDPFQEKGWLLGIYRNIYEIDLKNPSQQRILLSEQAMPQNVKSVQLFEDEGKIALFGNEIYLYDLKNGALETLTKAPEDGLLALTFKTFKDGKLCMAYLREKDTYDQNKFAEVNISAKTISLRSQACETASPTPYISNQNPETLDE